MTIRFYLYFFTCAVFCLVSIGYLLWHKFVLEEKTRLHKWLFWISLMVMILSGLGFGFLVYVKTTLDWFSEAFRNWPQPY